MGLINRISTLTSANLNALLDKVEDPEKLLREFLRQADNCKTKAYEAIVEAQAEVIILTREYGDNPSADMKDVLDKQKESVTQLCSSAEQLEERIAEAEGAVYSLIARHKIANTTIRTHKLLRGIGDRFGTLKGFEAMRRKIEREEVMAEVMSSAHRREE